MALLNANDLNRTCPGIELETHSAEEIAHACLTVLYLAGIPRSVKVSRAGAAAVTALILQMAPRGLDSVVSQLRRKGFETEAFLLSQSDLCLSAPHQCQSGSEGFSVLTAADGFWPTSWLTPRRCLALPALYMRGNPELLASFSSRSLSKIGNRLNLNGRLIGVAGSTKPTPASAKLAIQLGHWIANEGATLVSGGAPGVDLLAEHAALLAGGSVIEIRPCGLAYPWGISQLARNRAPVRNNLLSISSTPLDAPFATPFAMERNAQIYSLCPLTFVVQPQYKTGGTWHGACRALHSHLGAVVVSPVVDPANLALKALGAWEFSFSRTRQPLSSSFQPEPGGPFRLSGGITLTASLQTLFETIEF